MLAAPVFKGCAALSKSSAETVVSKTLSGRLSLVLSEYLKFVHTFLFLPDWRPMLTRLRNILTGAIMVLAASLSLLASDTPAAGPNSHPTYQQLRNLTLAGEAVSVSNFDLKRDAATFHLRSGTLC